jgi:hypothetical protein
MAPGFNALGPSFVWNQRGTVFRPWYDFSMEMGQKMGIGEKIETRVASPKRLIFLYLVDYKGNSQCYGGETGIRTLDTLSSMPPFQGGTFNHSAISPLY